MKRLRNPGILKAPKEHYHSQSKDLASACVVSSQADAAFPQIQTFGRLNLCRGDLIIKAQCMVENRHMVLRSSYAEIRCGRAGRLVDKFERVNERIRFDGISAVFARELGLLRALQCCRVQQGRTAGRSGRFDRTIVENSKRHSHVTGNVRGPCDWRIDRRRQFSYYNCRMAWVRSSRILSRRRQQPATFHMSDSIFDGMFKPAIERVTPSRYCVTREEIK
jgi:hypothetical protein